MSVTDYKVLSSSEPQTLINEVRSLMQTGWQPVPGYVSSSFNTGAQLCQVMAKGTGSSYTDYNLVVATKTEVLNSLINSAILDGWDILPVGVGGEYPRSLLCQPLIKGSGGNTSSTISDVDNISLLRSTSPAYPGMLMNVVSYHAGWQGSVAGPIGGGLFWYDSSDTTTADDGVFTFVTSGGKRWKRQLYDKNYSIALGGIRPGDDYTAVVKIIIAKLLSTFTSQTTSAYTPINYQMGSVVIPPGNYIQSSTIQIYSVTPVNFKGQVSIDARTVVSGKAIFNLSNDGFAAANRPAYFNGGVLLNGVDGRVNIVGSQTVPAIAVGNTQTGRASCSGHLAHNLNIIQCTKMIDFTGSVDTYLCNFSRIGGYGFSSNGIDFSQTTSTNSGERMTFDEVTISGVTGHAINVSQPGVMLVLDRCSIDFVNGNGINTTATATYVQIDITSGSHIEAVDGYFISNTVTSNKILWQGGQWLPTSRTNGTRTNYQGRQLIYGYLPSVKLRDIMILNTSVADGSSVYIGLPSDTSTRRTFDVSGIVDYFGLVPSVFDICNTGNDFSLETVGSTLSTSSTSIVKFIKPSDVSSWINGVTGTIVTLSDGTSALQIVPSTTGLTTNYIVLTTVDYIPVIPSRSVVKLWVVGQPLTSAIRYRITNQVKWYDSNKTLISTTTAGGTSDLYTNSQITTLPSYSSNPVTNGNRKLASLVNAVPAPAGAVYARPVWTISGIDQAININQLNVTVN